MNVKAMVNRKNIILLKELVVTDFKLRYQGSVLGYSWSILKPLFLFAIMYVVFTKFLGVGKDIPHYAVALLFGIVIWNFFLEATSNGLNSIVSRGDLIRKINFPKYIIVISGTISSLINLGLNLIIILLFAIINGVSFSFDMFLILPLILEVYIFGLAIAFFLAALNVKFRDIGYLWEIFSQALFYGTPIIYTVQMVMTFDVSYAKIMILNPIAQAIQDMRALLIGPEHMITIRDLFHSWYMLITPFVLVILMLILGSLYFKKHSKTFAENI